MNLITKSDIGKKFIMDGIVNNEVTLLEVRSDGWVAVTDKATNVLIVNPNRLNTLEYKEPVVDEPKEFKKPSPPYIKQPTMIVMEGYTEEGDFVKQYIKGDDAVLWFKNLREVCVFSEFHRGGINWDEINWTKILTKVDK